MDKYSFHVFWSDEDESYITTCPEFPDLSTFGETAEQSLSEMKVVLESVIETYREEGWPIPEPRKLSTYSGQFRVRMPKSLHAKLAAQAEVEGVSLNTLVVTYLSEGVGTRNSTSKLEIAMEHFLNQLKEKSGVLTNS